MTERWKIFEFAYSAETLARMARERSKEDGCSTCGGPCGFGSQVVVTRFGERQAPVLAHCYCYPCWQVREREIAAAKEDTSRTNVTVTRAGSSRRKEPPIVDPRQASLFEDER